MYIPNKLEVRETNKGKTLFTREKVSIDEILIKFEGQILNYSTKTSLQIDENKHLEGPGEIDDFSNHNCEPNCYVSFKDLTFRAFRNIKKR